jgi:hypothetical protein
MAEGMITTARMPYLPRLGEPAPKFEAETTLGPLRMEDFQERNFLELL